MPSSITWISFTRLCSSINRLDKFKSWRISRKLRQILLKSKRIKFAKDFCAHSATTPIRNFLILLRMRLSRANSSATNWWPLWPSHFTPNIIWSLDTCWFMMSGYTWLQTGVLLKMIWLELSTKDMSKLVRCVNRIQEKVVSNFAKNFHSISAAKFSTENKYSLPTIIKIFRNFTSSIKKASKSYLARIISFGTLNRSKNFGVNLLPVHMEE